MLLDKADKESFHHLFFAAKVQRLEGRIEEGLASILKAQEHFHISDRTREYADVLDEYSVLQRLNAYDSQLSINTINRSIAIRKSLGDSSATATSYLYKANTYVNWNNMPGFIDSALIYYNRSSTYYPAEKSMSKVILMHNMAFLHIESGDFRKALDIYKETAMVLQSSGREQDYLDAELSIVSTFCDMDEPDSAMFHLKIIEQHPFAHSNALIKNAILRNKAKISALEGEYKQAYIWQDSLDMQIHDLFNERQQEADKKYNNERLKREIAEENLKSNNLRNWIIGLSSIIIFSGLGLIGLAYMQRQRNELREQHRRYEKQQALQNERDRIAAEMHDDLGGGLTTIKYMSQKALRNNASQDQRQLLSKISDQSTHLVTSMSDIIWAMNSKFDDLASTVAYIRRYSVQYLRAGDVECDFVSEMDSQDIEVSGTLRRDLLLVVKEVLHNVLKHAKASSCNIHMSRIEDNILLKIKDNGIGLPGKNNILGNGLQNITDRIEKHNGEITLETDEGLTINIRLPILN